MLECQNDGRFQYFGIGKDSTMETDNIIREKIGAWLLGEGHTRELLASELGMTRPTLADRLNGTTKWRWDEVIEIARITNCSLNELAGLAG